MKKLLFSAALLTATIASAQVLITETFDDMKPGNLTEGMTLAGQNGWNVYSGSVADYQIMDTGDDHGKTLFLTGGAGTTIADIRWAFKDIEASWAARDNDKNILVGQFEIYTGKPTGSHRLGAVLYDSKGSTIAGITYDTKAKTVRGLASLVKDGDTQATAYNIGLWSDQFQEDTWIKVGFSYNKTDGEIAYRVGDKQTLLQIDGYSVAKDIDPAEFDFFLPYSTGNNAKYTGAVDNLKLQAVDKLETFLSTATATIESAVAEVSVFPNPVTDVLNIRTADKVLSAKVFDASGKAVQTATASKSLNVSKLPKGAYILKVETSGGLSTHKFIKK